MALATNYWYVMGVLDHEDDGTKPHKISGCFRTSPDPAGEFARRAKLSICSRRPDLVTVCCKRTHKGEMEL